MTRARGILHRTACGRYETENGHILSSGDVVDLKLGDRWYKTYIIYDGKRYYAHGLKAILLDGIEIRYNAATSRTARKAGKTATNAGSIPAVATSAYIFY